jgi:hypothetical protein
MGNLYLTMVNANGNLCTLHEGRLSLYQLSPAGFGPRNQRDTDAIKDARLDSLQYRSISFSEGCQLSHKSEGLRNDSRNN